MKKNHFLLTAVLMILLCGAAAAVTNLKRAEAYYEQGYLYYMDGDYADARPEFVKALKLEPKMAKSFYWIAKVDYATGRYKNAVANSDAALSLDPKLTGASTLRKEALKAAQKQASAVRTSGTVKPAVAAAVTYPATAAVTPSAVTGSAATSFETQAVSEPAKPFVAAKPPVTSYQSSDRPKRTQTISLDMRNVDVSSVLETFSNETGMNIIAGKDVYGKITIKVTNMDPLEALDMILKSNGFTYVREGNTVRVFSSSEPERVEELPGGQFVKTFSIDYAAADKLIETLKRLMPGTADIYNTEGTNMIIVKGTGNDIRRAEILIRNMDIPPREVMVEAKMVEIDDNQGHTLGTNASWTNPNNPNEVAQTVGQAASPTDTGALGLYYSVTNQSVTALVEALSTRTGFNILSSPKVLALDGETSEIITGSELGYYVNTITPTGTIQSVQFLDVGTKLTITPSVKSDGSIVMTIHPEISDGAIVNQLPQKDTTETTTKLIVKDGQTIVIGGLIRNTSEKVTKGIPIISDIPFLGILFKRTELTSERKQVIVLMTPHIINPQFASEEQIKAEQFENKMIETTPQPPLDLAK